MNTGSAEGSQVAEPEPEPEPEPVEFVLPPAPISTGMDASAKAFGAVFKVMGPCECLTGYMVQADYDGRVGATHDDRPQYAQLNMSTGKPESSNKMQVYYANVLLIKKPYHFHSKYRSVVRG